MMQQFLLAEHVQKRYGDFLAVRDAGLELCEGEILALLGPNGAGKTTFIKILATLLEKDAGRVTILGFDLDQQPEEIRHLFGYVGQDTERSAYARLTVVENLQFFGRLRGMGRKQIDQQIERLAADFDFTGNLYKQFVTLSGGQKQTVVIMRAFLHDPPLVYLDEPTKGLDPIIARRIRSFLMRSVHQDRKALLLTSHIMTEVDEMANRVALIHRGVIPVCGTPGELKQAIGTTEFVEVQGPIPAYLLEQLQQLAEVSSCTERTSGWWAFGVADPMAGAEAVIHTLRLNHFQTHIRHHTVTLEDAFLHHIGELAERFD